VADTAARASQRRGNKRRVEEGVWYPRWFWPSFATPASLYLFVFFVLPLYVIVSIAFGTVDQTFQSPRPIYQPWFWTSQYMTKVLGDAVGYERGVYLRTLIYVLIASVLCVLIAYTVAYYVSRFGGRRKGLFLTLLIAPFFVSYLMRMLAWINLLQPTGYVNKIFGWIPFLPHNVNWLGGYPGTVVLGLVYGYVPYMILPLYGFLDRIQQSLLEAGRDLGASPARTFMRVTLPLSRQAILAGIVIVTLPMFGDYYTNNLLSGSPKTQMVGNLLDNAVNATGQGPLAAVLVLVIMIILLVPMAYYLRSTSNELKVAS
jgi:ABC-type spermidine/putrescine transport system permease subunit I